jgi:hypothetical protein
MSVIYRVSPAERIVYLTVVGAATAREMSDAMLSALADPDYRPGFDFLSDRSHGTDCPDTACVRAGVDFLREHSAEMGYYRWAAVSPHAAVYGMLRMFSMLGETRGIRAEPFADFDEARRWLLDRRG